ncbi:MAG: FAD-dependent oxidoreductase, partial [Anaerolineales bacterium]
ASPSQTKNIPISPTGLPYIGYTKFYSNLILAVGHAMLGLSLGPGTGQLVADLAAGQSPAFDIRPFAI